MFRCSHSLVVFVTNTGVSCVFETVLCQGQICNLRETWLDGQGFDFFFF
jgi:hypothetical protein